MDKSQVRDRLGTASGFTLLELLIAVVVVAILAAIALPSYQDYITRSRARTASADLMALATALENEFQRTLQYPSASTASTADTKSAINPGGNIVTWSPSQDDFFSYTMTSSANSYTLTATGTGAMNGCTLTLTHANARTATGDCGISSW